jgi:hypothetical protein
MTEISFPPLRDLPSGHLAARKQHLLREIAREQERPRLLPSIPLLQRRRSWRPGVVVVVAVAALAGAGFAIAASLGVFSRAAMTGETPVQLAYSSTALWAASDSGLHALEPVTGRMLSTPKTTYPNAEWFAVGGGATWIASVRVGREGWTAGAVDRVDLKTGRSTVALRSPHRGIFGIAYAMHTLWILLARPTQPMRFEVARLDTRDGSLRYFTISGHPGLIAASPSGLWISGDNSLRLMHPNGGVSRIASVANAGLLTISGGSVWVTSRHSLMRFNERSHRPLTALDLGGPAGALTAATGRVWVTVNPANAAVGFSRLLRINSRTGRITGQRILSRTHKKLVEPTSIAANQNHVWLGISGTDISAHKQTILRLDAASLAQEQVFLFR